MGKTIAVIGLGNPLRRDDGIGIVLLERLRSAMQNVSEEIDFIDGGIAGMNLLHLIDSYDVVLLIDALDFRGNIGESRFFSYEEVKRSKKPANITSHTEDVIQVLSTADTLGSLPEQVYIFGVQPLDLSYGMGLSTAVETRIDILLNNLIDIFSKMVEKYQK